MPSTFLKSCGNKEKRGREEVRERAIGKNESGWEKRG